jgi:hypothetical protein
MTSVGSATAAADFSSCEDGEAPTPPSGGQGEDGYMVCYEVWLEWAQYGIYEFLGYVCWLYGEPYMS